MKPVLIDTGPIVAYLDRSDSHHALVADGIGGFHTYRFNRKQSFTLLLQA